MYLFGAHFEGAPPEVRANPAAYFFPKMGEEGFLWFEKAPYEDRCRRRLRDGGLVCVCVCGWLDGWVGKCVVGLSVGVRARVLAQCERK
jgi:hypothetical protein